MTNNTIYEQAIELAHRKIKLGKYENISDAFRLKLIEECYFQLLYAGYTQKQARR